MTTYAEIRRFKPFDWNAFLEKAIAHNATDEETIEARNLSGKWPTCACGIQCASIPRDAGGEPVDYRLADLGAQFHYEIGERLWNLAKITMGRIEQRSAQILADKEQAR